MNKSEREVIANAVGRLKADNPRCSDRVRAILQDPTFRIYFDTWVIPSLEILIEEDRSTHRLKLAVDLSR